MISGIAQACKEQPSAIAKVTRAQLGDFLGISPVHVNRVIQEMQRVGLLIWERQSITIPHGKQPADAWQFDPTYLYLGRVPR